MIGSLKPFGLKSTRIDDFLDIFAATGESIFPIYIVPLLAHPSVQPSAFRPKFAATPASDSSLNAATKEFAKCLNPESHSDFLFSIADIFVS